ncbi:MAG: protein kinase [Polyangiaceae bacterium]|nr:protein kinase [Polyangiaceae bacterium]
MKAPGRRGPDFSPGERFGDYEIVRLLATGGQSRLYEARHTLLGRRDALKFLRASADDDALARLRLEDEARLLVELGEHPNLPRIYTASFTDEGYLFMALEYLEGHDLRDILVSRRQLDLDEVCYLGAEVASALVPAHARGVVHRDLKPENVFVTARPTGAQAAPVVPVALGGKARVRVLDFGIAKLRRTHKRTQDGIAMGTPHSMAPEQARGEPVDGRTDLYALAAILWECLVGRHMFSDESGRLPSGSDLVMMQLEVTPRRVDELRPDVPPSLAALVRRGLAKDPAERFRHMAELGERLRRELAALPACDPDALFTLRADDEPSRARARAEARRRAAAEETRAAGVVGPRDARHAYTLPGPVPSLGGRPAPAAGPASAEPPAAPSRPALPFAAPPELYPQLVVVATEDPSLPAGSVIELAGTAFWVGWHKDAHVGIHYDGDAAIAAELEVAGDELVVRSLGWSEPEPPDAIGLEPEPGAAGEPSAPGPPRLAHGRGFAIGGAALRFVARPDARFRAEGEPPRRVVAAGADAVGTPSMRRVIAWRLEHLPSAAGGADAPRLVVRAASGELDEESRARGSAPLRVGASYLLVRSRLLVGRDPCAAIHLPERTVSARHALVVAERGRYRLWNLSRSNGTQVNGAVVEDAWLSDGDAIAVGDVVLVYRS